jgi:hypothetical protein
LFASAILWVSSRFLQAEPTPFDASIISFVNLSINDLPPRFLADSYFLKFPQGSQIVGNAPGNHTVDLTFSASGSSTVKNRQQYAKNYYSGTSVDGSIKLTGVALTDGKLAKDTYMYVRASREPGSTFTLEVKEGTNSVSYTLTSGSSHKSTGGVYKLNQSNFTPILDF